MPRLLAFSFLVVSACADPFGKTDPDDPDHDTAGTDSAGGDTAGGNDTADSGDTSTDTGPDTGASEVVVPGSAGCAAGGTVTGGGYTGTFCLAPVDLAAGTVATGGGYTWQPGPVVLLPR